MNSRKQAKETNFSFLSSATVGVIVFLVSKEREKNMKINHLPPAKQNLVVETLREPENAQYENITYDYIEKHITEFRLGCPRSIMSNLQWLRQIRNSVKDAVFLPDSLKSLENFRLEGLLFPDGSRSFIVKDSFQALFCNPHCNNQ